MSENRLHTCFYDGREYEAVVPPCGDSYEIGQRGDRLMFRHQKTGNGSHLFIAKQYEMAVGWVLGIFI